MDKKVHELLNNQINKEFYSAYLYLEFSNGDTVTVLGKNTCPSGFTDLLQTVSEIFYNTLEPQTAEGSGSL